MTISTPITSLTMSDGTTVSVPPGGIVVFVGPNNSGKSLSLRNIREHLQEGVTPLQAVQKIEVEKIGTEDDLKAWLDTTFPTHYQGGRKYYSVSGNNLDAQVAPNFWRSGHPYRDLASAFVFFAAGEGRLQAVNPAQNIDFRSTVPSHPLQTMYKDTDLERKLNEICLRTFDKPLFLDRFAGSTLYLSVGKPPAPPENIVSPPKEYLDVLSSFPTLNDQGDGMKSFMGLMLHLTTRPYHFVLVDEPEAFLHPPQARLMGRLLVEEKPAEAQVFVATHDNDVLTGLLEAPEAEITVVRLDWDGQVNHTSPLDPEKVRDLWKDSLLRYSNILDGLFHEGVVLCEGDADCRFYGSVLDAMETDGAISKNPDLHFTHCGGKDRMPTVISALRAVSVPVKVVADFDVLRDKGTFRKIVESLGGAWNSIESDWNILTSALQSKLKAPSISYVREEIDKVFAAAPEQTLQKEDSEKIKQLTKVASAWDEVKRSGTHAVPAGDATQSLKTLLEKLRVLGLFVVKVGELESFVREIGGHGPTWVNEVHRRKFHTDPSRTEEARKFMKAVGESVLT